MENLLQNIASGLWIVIGIQVLVWLKHWNKKFSELYDELKHETGGVHGRKDGWFGMKIYKNPWVTRESYFVKTGAARSAKMEAAKSTGYSVDFWDGKWKVRKATYYNKSLDEMPVVCENKVSIQAVIGKAVLDAVRGFAGGGKSDGEETPQAGWLPVYESEITGWDPALAGRDPIGGYACSKCGHEAVYSCNDEYVLSDYCPGCGARMAGGAE